jgi:integrase
MRALITETIIARVTGSATEVWDTKVSGLVLRCSVTGRSVWFIRAWTADGKRTRVKLGEHPHIGVAEARRLALAQLGAIQQGRDPVAERRAAREARKAAHAALTVGDAMAAWQAARSQAVEKSWSPRYARATASALRVHVPPGLRSKPLREVTRETWTKLLAEVARSKPGAGAYLYTVVSSFLAYAEVMGWIEHHPLPRRGRSLIAPHVPPRTRVLEDWEWKAIWQAAEREPPKLRAFVRMLILTATRVSEVADLAANEIVSDRTVWVIPATRAKNRREHLLPLDDLARHELGLVWPQEVGASDTKLLGRSGHRGFSGQGKLLLRIQRASGTMNWTWHDLRRTARTTMSYLGISAADAEAALNHVSQRGKLVAVYDLSGPPPSAMKALRAWQAYVGEVLSGQRPVGDAEAQHRAGLPEEIRLRSKPAFVGRPKAKPGRSQRDQLDVARDREHHGDEVVGAAVQAGDLATAVTVAGSD